LRELLTIFLETNKMLQLPGTLFPSPVTYRGFAPGPHWGGASVP